MPIRVAISGWSGGPVVDGRGSQLSSEDEPVIDEVDMARWLYR